MKKLLFYFVLLLTGYHLGNHDLRAQVLEVIVKDVHPKLTWVAAEDMRVPGHSFKQKGYNKGDFDAQFTSCMLWVKPIIKAPFSPKVAQKFEEDFQTGSFTPFLWHFATDTRAKQKQKSDPKKYKNLEMGDPELDSIMGFPAVVLPYRFTRDDNRLLKTMGRHPLLEEERLYLWMGT